ncbi:MAG TPA: hypothetical protein VMU22_05110 [Rhizomicrobium sp.]|nr:hypothetical protein [Rhizomicrobium sp.]
MKFAVLVGAAAAFGMIAAVAVPSAAIESGALQVQALGDRIGGIKLADLNPIRAIYDWEAEQIKKPMTPEELGIHHQELTLRPIDLNTTDTFRPVDLGNLQHNGYRDVRGSIQPH